MCMCFEKEIIMKKNNKKENKETKGENYWLPIGMCLGISIGSGVGIATDNIAIWLPVGLCIGLALGVALSSNEEEK